MPFRRHGDHLPAQSCSGIPGPFAPSLGLASKRPFPAPPPAIHPRPHSTQQVVAGAATQRGHSGAGCAPGFTQQHREGVQQCVRVPPPPSTGSWGRGLTIWALVSAGPVSKVPSRPLPKLAGPGRHGQECGHPEVSVHTGSPGEGLAGGAGGFTAVSHGHSWLKGGAGVRSPSKPGPPHPGRASVPGDACPCPSRASSSESLSAKTCSLFLPDYIQDKYLLQLLRSSDDVSTWVAAEVVTSHTAKVGGTSALQLRARGRAWSPIRPLGPCRRALEAGVSQASGLHGTAHVSPRHTSHTCMCTVPHAVTHTHTHSEDAPPALPTPLPQPCPSCEWGLPTVP